MTCGALALTILMNIVVNAIPLDQLGISDSTRVAAVTAGFAIPSGFTILVTGLIAARLLLARRQHLRILGKRLMIFSV